MINTHKIKILHVSKKKKRKFTVFLFCFVLLFCVRFVSYAFFVFVIRLSFIIYTYTLCFVFVNLCVSIRVLIVNLFFTWFLRTIDNFLEIQPLQPRKNLVRCKHSKNDTTPLFNGLTQRWILHKYICVSFLITKMIVLNFCMDCCN